MCKPNLSILLQDLRSWVGVVLAGLGIILRFFTSISSLLMLALVAIGLLVVLFALYGARPKFTGAIDFCTSRATMRSMDFGVEGGSIEYDFFVLARIANDHSASARIESVKARIFARSTAFNPPRLVSFLLERVEDPTDCFATKRGISFEDAVRRRDTRLTNLLDVARNKSLKHGDDPIKGWVRFVGDGPIIEPHSESRVILSLVDSSGCKHKIVGNAPWTDAWQLTKVEQ